jgi:hypothetical protein
MANRLTIDPTFIEPPPRVELDGSMGICSTEFESVISCMMKEIAMQPVVGGEHIGLLMFLHRARCLLQSVQLLTARGYIVEAFAVMRSMTECTIDIAYILHADSKDRMDAFTNFVHVVNKRRQDRMAGQGMQVSQESARKVDLAASRVTSSYNAKQLSWDKKTLKDRAAEAGRLKLYEDFYDVGCGASHSSPEAIFWAQDLTVEGDDPEIHINLSARVPEGPERFNPYRMTCLALVHLLLSVAGYMDSDSLMTRINDAWQRVSMTLK